MTEWLSRASLLRSYAPVRRYKKGLGVAINAIMDVVQ
jgi:hypothetical protein